MPLLKKFCCQQNKSLKELKIGKNLFGVKPKNMKKVMEALMELVQEEESVRTVY